MPMLDLTIDGYQFHICTPDFEMAGKWLMDLLSLYRPDPATNLRLEARPFLVPDPRGREYPWVPDWDVWTYQWSPNMEGVFSAPDAMRKLADQIRSRADQLDPPADTTPEQS